MYKTLVTLLSATVLAAPVQASIINIEYTAKISGITVRDTLDDGSVAFHAEQSFNIGGNLVSRGEKLTGYINYDTNTPYVSPAYADDTNTAMYWNNGFPNRVRLQFDGGFSFTSRLGQGAAFAVFNNSAYVYGYDAWGVWASDGPWEWANLTMYDYSGQMFSDTSLATPSFDLARNTVLNFAHADPTSGQHIYIVAELDSIQQVPEPATLATMAAGLGLLAALRRRKTSGAK